MARNTARINESEMVLNLRPVPGEEAVHIEIHDPSSQAATTLTDDIMLPKGIVILSLDDEFRFDYRGEIDEVGTILFADVDHPTEIRQVELSRL